MSLLVLYQWIYPEVIFPTSTRPSSGPVLPCYQHRAVEDDLQHAGRLLRLGPLGWPLPGVQASVV